jgi:hypothetical protein
MIFGDAIAGMRCIMMNAADNQQNAATMLVFSGMLYQLFTCCPGFCPQVQYQKEKEEHKDRIERQLVAQAKQAGNSSASSQPPGAHMYGFYYW